MNWKNNALLGLILSFPAYPMWISQLSPKEKTHEDSIVSTAFCLNAFQAHQNYRFNQLFFDTAMIPDIQPRIMNHLDHRSNIWLIQISKHLYQRYVRATSGQTEYNHSLFTKHPFVFNKMADFNVYFNCYTRALFHYAPRPEDPAAILLSLEDKTIQEAHTGMLSKFKINNANADAISVFYQQYLSDDQLKRLVWEPNLLQEMLQRGISPNAKTSELCLFHQCVFHQRAESLVNILLQDLRTNVNIEQGSRAITPLMCAIMCKNNRIIKILLDDPRIDLDINIKNAFECAIGKNNVEGMKILAHYIDFNKYGMELLDFAVGKKSDEGVKILLECSEIDSNVKYKHGFTSSHSAALCGYKKVVKALLASNRVDPNVVGPMLRTAYSTATDPEIIRLLSERTSLYIKNLPFIVLIGLPTALLVAIFLC